MVPRSALANPVALAAALVAYGNLSGYLVRYAGVQLPGGMMWPNLAGLGLLLAWATRRGGLRTGDLGLRRRGALKSSAWGALTGALMALPALAVFAFPPLLPAPISYRPMAAIEPSRFLLKILLEVPIATALCEELAFRGVLAALFRRALSPFAAIAATNAAFGLWHLVANYHTVSETNVASTGLAPLAQAAGLAGVFAGGVAFSLLRERTRSVVGSVVAHWAVDALMLASMYRRG